ncbi:F-box/LRR-repeat protein 13-like isoform X1 [Vicia villosa]|uniref:F-box/LRR-repeat protein 13-like isoform X1 n=2 Tax=Vicia villosa TaxID=3911 RepID=UPI00273BC952|nr:F-box/LRR-repeat protein 13-like isoform X1 [Vicia villosa]XP_058768143.1 F-box/LRR-repeat protein 13-like isoform X1 [Vicia villosa]
MLLRQMANNRTMKTCRTMKTRRRYYGKDRISCLPDCLLLHILSNLEAKQAVQISILSTRWKDLWKNISVLSLSRNFRNFQSLESFATFVSQFFSSRDDKTSLQALTFECTHYFDPNLLKRIIKYLFSHNIQHLDMKVACSLEHFPLCTNSSYHTLTSLKLISWEEVQQWGRQKPVFPNSLQFPALTYLSLQSFTFRCTTDDGYADPFSVFQSLNTLIIECCSLYNEKTRVEDNLFISSVSLVNLTIVLPANYKSYKLKLSTPNLFSFDFTGHPFQNLCGHHNISNTNFSYIKHVKIHLPFHKVTNFPSILFNWLVELDLMESLAISSETLEILKLIPDSWKIDFPYLHNLKLLEIEIHEFSSLPDGTEDFLLQNAPSAKKVIFPGPTLKDLICNDSWINEAKTRRKQSRH